MAARLVGKVAAGGVVALLFVLLGVIGLDRVALALLRREALGETTVVRCRPGANAR